MTQNDGSPKPRQRWPSRETIPAVADIAKLKAEAQNQVGNLIELPWTVNGLSSVLTACCAAAGKDPLWTLYQGQGTESMVIWTNVESDVELIYDVLCMAGSSATTPKTQTAAADLKAHIPYDMSLLEKQPNVLLGYLLVEAGLISEPNLEQALKLQELVRSGSLATADVAEAMRRVCQPVKPEPSASKPPASNSQQVIDFLKQAGILTEQDIQLAVLSWLQSQGNLGNILVQSGKVDTATFEAASACVALIQKSEMKPEQAIMALHYCSRSRVSLAEALQEMGLEKPASLK